MFSTNLRLAALLVFLPVSLAAQSAPATLAPSGYDVTPIVMPEGYDLDVAPLFPVIPMTGGGVVLGTVKDPSGRVVPFAWSAGDFVDLAAVVDAVLPNPFLNFLPRRVNGSGVTTGSVHYLDANGGARSDVFILDPVAQSLTLHGAGIGVAINEAGDVVVASPAGYELLRDGVRTSYTPNPWPRDSYFLNMMEDGSFVGANFGQTGVFRWMPDGTSVEVTPAAVTSPVEQVNVNAHGDMVINGPSQSLLVDAAGNLLREFPTWASVYFLSDERTVYRPGLSASLPPSVGWNGHWVALLSLVSPLAETVRITSVDRAGNIAAISVAGGVSRWGGVDVDGLYLERRMDVRPAIVMRAPEPFTQEFSQLQEFSTASDTEIEIDLFGGEVDAPAVVLLAPPGVPPIVLATGVVGMDGKFGFSLPIAAGVSYPGVTFDVIGVTLMDTAPLDFGISLPQSFQLVN